MSTTQVTVKYRPLRIGFLVREGSIDNVVEAAGINTLLWGGIYNPIIPVSSDSVGSAKELVDLFSVDILYAVEQSEEVSKFINQYPNLRNPELRDMFNEDWRTKTNLVVYLDSLNIVKTLWEREYKHKGESYKSNCVLVNWSDEDNLGSLLSILFGYFPVGLNLKNDYKKAFLRGLRADELLISPGSPIHGNLSRTISPISLTEWDLRGYGSLFDGDGIYVGESANFEDLVYFWDLRASGLNMAFLPIDNQDRFFSYIKTYLERLDKRPTRNPNIEEQIWIYSRLNDQNALNAVVDKFPTSKKIYFTQCLLKDFNAVPVTFTFDWTNSMATVEKSHNRYSVYINLPEKKFLETMDHDVSFQTLNVSVDPLSEYDYPDYTLKPPYIPRLNEFYSREIAIHPWKARCEKEGLACIIDVHENYLHLYPINQQVLIKKIFELANIKAEISPAGHLANKIIEKLEGIDGGRVFKIRGVRKLVQNLKADDCISRGAATNVIWDDGDFKKHEMLYIEQRENKQLTTQQVFDFLLKKDFFRAGLELICDSCRQKVWLSLKEIDDLWVWHYCGAGNVTSLHLKNRGDWMFRKSGLFAKDNNQEGAMPVILSLLVFLRIFNPSHFLYSPSLKLKADNIDCEIDFCVVQHGRGGIGGTVELGIGECKSEGGKIDLKDIDNIKAVIANLESIGLDCCSIFSKPVQEFQHDELQLFTDLASQGIRPVLLTDREMEPYHPYWEKAENKLPYKYAFTLGELASNSEFIYLRPNTT